MILFLDYDGVLHPDKSLFINGQPMLQGHGECFMWAPLLESVLKTAPQVRIVLSTTWARDLGLVLAKGWLPDALQERVIGATWDESMKQSETEYEGRSTWWDMATRYQQIKRYVDLNNVTRWVAIDDRPDGWADKHKWNLVRTDSIVGLSDPRAIELLRSKLALRKTIGLV
jgi:hypothetical protein